MYLVYMQWLRRAAQTQKHFLRSRLVTTYFRTCFEWQRILFVVDRVWIHWKHSKCHTVWNAFCESTVGPSLHLHGTAYSFSPLFLSQTTQGQSPTKPDEKRTYRGCILKRIQSVITEHRVRCHANTSPKHCSTLSDRGHVNEIPCPVLTVMAPSSG